MKEEIITFPKHQLELSIKTNENYTELSLKNLKFQRSRLKVLQLFLISLLIYLSILITFTPSHYALHTTFFLFATACFYSLTNIVEKEVVKVLKGFGLQYSTHYTFSRKSNFIPSNNIYRIVINEVIYLNQVIFVLQILTAKEFHQQTPIVVLFDNLLPPLDCLKTVYNIVS